MHDMPTLVPIQFLFAVLLILPGLVLIGIDYLLYQSLDRRVLLLATGLVLLLLCCVLLKAFIQL